MEDKILQMFFDPKRWEYAIEKGCVKDVPKNVLYQLCKPEVRVRMYRAIAKGEYEIAPPHTAQIPKDTPGEFRTVYVNEGVDRVLLSIANDLLFELMPDRVHPRCKSYLKGVGCGKVVQEVRQQILLNDMGSKAFNNTKPLGWKSDLSKYFDSVPVGYIDGAFDMVEERYGHSALIDVLRKYYHSDLYIDGETKQVCSKYQSLKQGCSVASWLADVLLYHIDDQLSQLDGYYVRYSDDMLFIGQHRADKAMRILTEELAKMQMKLNPKKVERLDAQHWFKFLGYSIKGASISLSSSRIKRFQKEIEARTIKRPAADSAGTTAAIRRVNRYLYHGDGQGHSWATQVLSVVNVKQDIDAMNAFVMDCLRAVHTGKTKIGGLGYDKQGRVGCIVRGRGRNVSANRRKTGDDIGGYLSLWCMRNAMRTSKAAYETLVRSLFVRADLQSDRKKYKHLQCDERTTSPDTHCDGIANPAEHGGTVAKAQKGATKAMKGVVTKAKRLQKKDSHLEVIMEEYSKLYETERTTMQEDEKQRRELNVVYDAFVEKYGPINYAPNKSVAERVNKELLALEIKGEDGTWQKADIFFKPVAFSTGEPSSTLTAHEALAASLNEKGRVDMPYMEQKTGLSEDELVEQLSGEVFYNPISGNYEIKAVFISGNVIEKLELVKKLDGGSGDFGDSIAALEAAIPAPIPFSDLDFNLGERWIDVKIYEEFARDFFTVADTKDWRGDTVSGRPEITIRYEKSIDQYSVDWSGWGNEKIRTQYSVEAETGNKVDGIDLLTHALMDTTPKLMRYKRKSSGMIETDEKGNKMKEEDPEKMQMAKTKIDEIRQAFNDWLQRLPQEKRDELADGYNRRFNCFVKPVYDGSHQTFPGLNYKGLTEKYGVRELYKSQKDCVWMLLQNGGGICDHEVGSGKTLIMVVTAHEMKRLGLAHKPMIIGLKANVSAIAETYRTAYPEAKVLFATEGDYSSANRVDFFNRMKTGDWDCVIMSHEQFGRIPQSMTMEREMAQELLQQCEDALDAVSRDRKVTKQMLKGLEKRKANLLAKISALNATLKEKKDEVVDFDQLGIDHILVDESHQFKNLGFVTRHDRVSGIGNVEGSQRAYNLKLALRTIQRKRNADLGATFLSGTTVTNSLTELYLLFDYLRPRALEKQGITCFDAWAAIFTKKSAEYEFSITNSIVLKERFRYFIKVPELAMFYNEITDYKTAEDVGIERPAKKPMLLKIKPTPDQEEYIKVLMEFAQNGDFSLIGIDNPTPQQEKAKMLYATDLARKMSMDMRLIDPCYGDHPDNKVSRCAQLIDRYYRAFDEMKGVQMVFSDLSTWDSSKWNVYAAIRDKLVDEYGIPKSEIRFIQEAKNDCQKQQIIDDANEGKVRVLFGSTSMLGTGVNAQKRVVAVHHLDTPWRPSDLEQRDGRAVRKGNEIARDYSDNTVDVIIYAVERSLDSYKFNLLHLKQVFISQLKRGQLNVRTLDEGAMDEKGGMNFAEYMAILSGNTDLLERAKMEKRIAALEGERKNFYRERHQTEEKRQWHKRDMERLCRSLDAAREDWQAFLSATGGARNNDITLHSFTVPDGFPVGSDDWTAAIGRELQRIDSTLLLAEDEVREIGTICGFPIQMKGKLHRRETTDGKQEELYQNVLSVRMPRLSWEGQNYGKLPRAGLRVSAEYPLQTVLRIEQSIRQWEIQAEQDRQTIDQLDAILTLEWGKEQQLTQLKADLQTLDRKIAKTVGKTEAEQQRIAAEADQKKPYTFDYERGEHKATFRRDAAPLVSIDEMREIAERNSDDHDWRRSVSVRNWNYGGYREERKKSGPDVEIESRQGDRCERTVLDIFALQAKREKDQAWLRAKAAEDTRGTEVYQDNEVIFAARKLMKQAA